MFSGFRGPDVLWVRGPDVVWVQRCRCVDVKREEVEVMRSEVSSWNSLLVITKIKERLMMCEGMEMIRCL